MPCRIITDVHEGTNEAPTVPAWKPVNLHIRRTDRIAPLGREDPVSFTAAIACSLGHHTERSQERRTIFSGRWECNHGTLTMVAR